MPKQKYTLSQPLIKAIKNTHAKVSHFRKLREEAHHSDSFDMEWLQPLYDVLNSGKTLYISEEHFVLLAEIFQNLDQIKYLDNTLGNTDEFFSLNKNLFELLELIFKHCELLINQKARPINITYFPVVINSLITYASCLIADGDWQSARNTLKKAKIYLTQLVHLGKETVTKEDVTRYFARYYASMGSVEAHFGNIDNAISSIAKADTWVESTEDLIDKMTLSSALSKSFLEIANKLLRLSRFKLALDMYDRALEIYNIIINENESLLKMMTPSQAALNINQGMLEEVEENKLYVEAQLLICKASICGTNHSNLVQLLDSQGIKFRVYANRNKQDQELLIEFADKIHADKFKECFKNTNFLELDNNLKDTQIIVNILSFDVKQYSKLCRRFIKALSAKDVDSKQEACDSSQPTKNEAQSTSAPVFKEEALSSIDEKQLKLTRHLQNEQMRKENKELADKDHIEPEKEEPAKEPAKVKATRWNNGFVPPTELFRVYTSVNNLKTFSAISEELELPTDLDANKIRTVASYGNVLTDERQGRQGYWFSKTDPAITKLGPNYKGKLILKGESGVGDHRAMMQVIGTGVEVTKVNGEVVKRKNVEVLSIDHFEGTHRKNKN